MEFDYSFQSNMGANTDRFLELEGGDDDHGDVLFAEIRRQILLLTADEEEDVHKEKPGSAFSPVKRSSKSLTAGGYPAIWQSGSYFNWWEKENPDRVPAWLANLWNNGNGTGVFIPQIVGSRRHQKPGRGKSERRIYKRVERRTHEHTVHLQESKNPEF